MSPELESDIVLLQKMGDALTPDERKAPINEIKTVAQLRVVAFAIACQLKAVCEREALTKSP